jgi:hypothetical protein
MNASLDLENLCFHHEPASAAMSQPKELNEESRFDHEVCHELTLAHRESKWSTSFKPLILGRVCHSRMLLAGIQAEYGLEPD